MVNKFIIIVFSIFLVTSCKEQTKPIVEETKQTSTEKEVSSSSVLDSMILENPKNAELFYKRAKYYIDVNYIPKALIDILTAIKLDSSKIDYYLMAGDIYINMGQGEDAVEVIQNGIRTNPDSEDLFIRNIEYLYFLKDYKKALIVTNDLLKKNRNNAEAYFFKGLIYKDLKNIDKAISSFQTCVEQDPSFYNAYMQLGLLFTEKNNDLAINYFDNALKLKEKSREALYGKAYYYQQQKKFNKAKKVYKSMMLNNRRDFQVVYNIGYCYLEQDSLKKAYKHFKLASSIKADYVDAIFMQGQINERWGKYAEARKQYNIALKLLPNNETILQSLKDIDGK